MAKQNRFNVLSAVFGNRGGINPQVVKEQKKKPLTTGQVMSHRQLTQEETAIMKYHVSPDPIVRSLSTKLVNPNQYSQSLQQQSRTVPLDAVTRQSSSLFTTVSNIESIKRNIPEIELIQDILVSCILSPHDLVTEEIHWSVGGNLPQVITSQMISILREHFSNDLKFDGRLTKILQDALFNKGSHILAVLPESAIDDIINGRAHTSLESLKSSLESTLDVDTGVYKSIGYLGLGLKQQDEVKHERESKVKVRTSLENYFNPELNPLSDKQNINNDIVPGLLRVTDNPNILKSSGIFKRIAQASIESQLMKSSLESAYFNPAVDDVDLDKTPAKTLYKNVEPVTMRHISIVNDRDTASRKSVGHPLLMEIPHESCIPVFTPGNPEDHLGYLILLDRTGNPVSLASNRDAINNMANNFSNMTNNNQQVTQVNGVQTVMSQTLSSLSSLTGTANCKIDQMNLNEMYDFSVRVIERDLLARFNDGIYGENIEIARPSEVYRIMLARMLAGSLTQLLYIPASLVTYFAFYYNDFGIGESLITRNEVKAAMKIVLSYANNLSNVRNAMGIRTLNIELDEDDESPEETLSKIINRYMEVNSLSQLYHTLDPSKIEHSLFRAAIDLKVSGNDGFETTSVDVEYKQGERPEIDTDYMELVDNEFFNGMQTPADLVTDATSNNFASEWATKYVLFMKRVRNKAIILNERLKDIVSKYTLHDGTLIKELSNVIRENAMHLPEEVLKECKETGSTIPVIKLFLEELDIGVPLPTGDTTESLMTNWEKEKKRIDEFVPILVPQESIENLIGENEPEKVKEVKGKIDELLKTHFYTKWIRENNAFPEFDELIMNGEDVNKELFKQLYAPMDSLSQALADVVHELWETKNPDDSGEGGDTSSSDVSETPSDDSTDTATNDDDEFPSDEPDDTEDENTEEEDDTETENEDEGETEDEVPDFDSGDGDGDTPPEE